MVPSCKTISVSNLQKINEFYEQGGTIIFTTRLPSQAVGKWENQEVIKIIKKLFPEGENSSGIVHMGQKGGKAVFVRQPNGQNLKEALVQAMDNFDVDYPINEDVRYIHKVINGQEMYYFANIGGQNVNILVTLRGNLKLQKWDPHTGKIQDLNTEKIFNDKTRASTTKGSLNLKPYHSCFWIGVRE